MKRLIYTIAIAISLLLIPYAYAIEPAQRITDKEIIERLTRLEEGQKALNQRLDDLRDDMNSRFGGVNSRFDDMNSRFDDMNSRINMLMWIMGLFVSVSLVVLGAVVRIQWQLNKRQAAIEKETSLLKGEMTFLKDAFLKMQEHIKSLIESLKPPRDVL